MQIVRSLSADNQAIFVSIFISFLFDYGAINKLKQTFIEKWAREKECETEIDGWAKAKHIKPQTWKKNIWRIFFVESSNKVTNLTRHINFYFCEVAQEENDKCQYKTHLDCSKKESFFIIFYCLLPSVIRLFSTINEFWNFAIFVIHIFQIKIYTFFIVGWFWLVVDRLIHRYASMEMMFFDFRDT